MTLSLAQESDAAGGNRLASQFEYPAAFQQPLMSNQHEGISMGKSGGLNRRSVHGRDIPNTSRVSTDELVDFMMAQALKRTIKEVCRLTGLSEKAVANIRGGLAGASAQTISTWCRSDPQFRAEYFYWCGGHIEGADAEAIAGLSIALNSYARRLHEGGR